MNLTEYLEARFTPHQLAVLQNRVMLISIAGLIISVVVFQKLALLACSLCLLGQGFGIYLGIINLCPHCGTPVGFRFFQERDENLKGYQSERRNFGFHHFSTKQCSDCGEKLDQRRD